MGRNLHYSAIRVIHLSPSELWDAKKSPLTQFAVGEAKRWIR